MEGIMRQDFESWAQSNNWCRLFNSTSIKVEASPPKGELFMQEYWVSPAGTVAELSYSNDRLVYYKPLLGEHESTGWRELTKNTTKKSKT